MNKDVKIYTTNNCPYCKNAKKLLKLKNIEFEEINVSDNEDYFLNELSKRTGVFTLPQIFVDEKFIGGCDDIYTLKRQNKLDELMK